MQPPQTRTPLRKALQIVYLRFSIVSRMLFLGRAMEILTKIAGTMIVGGGSGVNNPAYISSPLEALNQRAYEDGSQLLWDIANVNSTAQVDAASDACLVFLNAWASEGYD